MNKEGKAFYDDIEREISRTISRLCEECRDNDPEATPEEVNQYVKEHIGDCIDLERIIDCMFMMTEIKLNKLTNRDQQYALEKGVNSDGNV